MLLNCLTAPVEVAVLRLVRRLAHIPSRNRTMSYTSRICSRTAVSTDGHRDITDITSDCACLSLDLGIAEELAAGPIRTESPLR